MIKLKFLGQNCFLLSSNGKNLISDPFYSIGKKMSGFDVTSQKIDYILLTHAHGDHIADVEDVLQNHKEAIIIGTPEICGYYKKFKNIDFNIGGYIDIAELGVKISMVRADHTCSFPDGTYGGVPVGYIMQFGHKTLYMSGDTGVFSDMALFPELFGDIDISILPIGGHYTMCSKQAAFAGKNLLKTKKVIGCHFDTFSPIRVDHEKVKKEFSQKEQPFNLPRLGEEFIV